MIDASIIVLAGGASRRMGRSKQALAWNETTLLAHVVSVAQATCSEVLIAVDTGQRIAELAPATRAGAQIVVDDPPSVGPLGGVHAGIRAASHSACLVLTCDMPRITPSLLAQIHAQRAAHAAAVPVTSHGSQPLCAAYDRSIHSTLARFLAAGGRSARAFIDSLADVVTIPSAQLAHHTDTTEPFINLNTPDDYRRALAARPSADAAPTT